MTVRECKDLMLTQLGVSSFGTWAKNNTDLEHPCRVLWVRLNMLGARAMDRAEDVLDIDAEVTLTPEEEAELRAQLAQL